MTGPCLCGDPACARCFPQPYRVPRFSESAVSDMLAERHPPRRFVVDAARWNGNAIECLKRIADGRAGYPADEREEAKRLLGDVRDREFEDA